MSQLGVVTALTQFARSIGSTLGVAIFGSLLNNEFGPAFQSAIPPEVRAMVPPDQLAQLHRMEAFWAGQDAYSPGRPADGVVPKERPALWEDWDVRRDRQREISCYLTGPAFAEDLRLMERICPTATI